MNPNELDTKTKNTWCPGCSNFGILQAIKNAISILDKKGIKKERFVLTTGIGCHAKMSCLFFDSEFHINISFFQFIF